MSISSNRSFFHDDLTDRWTKIDWALNLIPLGGVASVAYEIGSSWLSSGERTAKISEDFFQSPIQTTFKKIAQCLWVPIIGCGVLKLVSFAVKACWNRCFPSVNSKNQVVDPCTILPPEISVNHIFSYLNLHELGVCRSVSRLWNEYASTPILWQSAIYREIAFNSKNWADLNADLVKDVNLRQEMLSLPKNIAEELRYSAFPGKSIRETHVLVRLPKELTIKNLEELAQKYFPDSIDRYSHIWSSIVEELEEKPVDESIWILMTKDVLPESRNKSYVEQEKIVADLAKAPRLPYHIPTTIEALTCILAEYSRSGSCLFNNTPWTYTRCKERVRCFQVIVGGFDPAGPHVSSSLFDSTDVGVAALRKF